MKTVVGIVLSLIMLYIFGAFISDALEETYQTGRAEGYRVGKDDGYIEGRSQGLYLGSNYGAGLMSLALMKKFDTKYWRDDYCSINVIKTWTDVNEQLRKEKEERKK